MEEKAKNESIEKTIKTTIEQMVDKMGFPSEVEVKKETLDGNETWIFNIKTEESSFLIGQYGVNLQSLQHITRLLVRKKIEERINFTIDVNSYRQEKNSSIEKLAASAAEQCLRENQEIIMRPMSPYERRIVHIELAKNKQVKTESLGEGEERRVVIKPANIL